MKKAIIQFIKKFNLARRFAAADSLVMLRRLKTFAVVYPLAALFSRRRPEGREERLASMLDNNADSVLKILLETAAVPAGCFGYRLPFLPQTLTGNRLLLDNSALKEQAFYLSLARELIRRDCPQAAPFYQLFCHRLNKLADLRLYAAGLEELHRFLSPLPEFCPYTVNWQKTSAAELWLDASSPLLLTANLPLSAQKNLLRLFSYLFCRCGIFVASFSYVAVDDSHRVALLDYDALHPVDSSLRVYLAAYLKTGQLPQGYSEYLLCRAVGLLRRFCPDCDMASELLAETEADPLFLFPAQTGFEERLEICRCRNLVLSPSADVPDPDPRRLLPLLDKNRFKKDPVFRKSSVWYYLPLLLAAYLLLRYF